MNTNKVTYNFGQKGTFMIIYSAVLVYFMTGMTVDGLNIIVPGFAALKGWNPDELLAIATPASVAALILTSFWGLAVKNFGLKQAATVALFAAGISVYLFGQSTNMLMYGIMQTLMITFINCFSVICGYAMIANWFPNKKGIVLGFTTMGMNFASATIPQLLNFFSTMFDPKGNITHSLNSFAVALIVVGIFNQLFIKPTPEEWGVHPDNEAPLMAEAPTEANKPGMTYLNALSSLTVWKLGLAYGLAGMGTVGIMSQLIPFLIGKHGYTLENALMTMSMAAIIGVFGSYLWGVIDQKWGTRFTTQIFGLWYAAAIGFLIAPGGQLTLMTGIVMIGLGIGGTGNFPPSMTTYCFGRNDFPIAFSVINMIMGVIRSTAFVVLGVVRGFTGDASSAYIIFLVLSVLSSISISFIKNKDASRTKSSVIDSALS